MVRAVLVPLVVALVSLCGPARAEMSALERVQLASALGTVIGSEAACGLSYDQAAIEAFIEKKVPADDMAFPSALDLMVGGTTAKIEDMSQSAKTAHCAQVRRIARSYGFVN